MNPTWLIEFGVYGDEIDPLVEEIHHQGMECAVVSHAAIRKGSSPFFLDRKVSPSDCVLAYGTFPFAQEILLHQPWRPGAWCTAKNLDCTVYYAYLGPYLLNRHYIILPGIEALRKKDWLFSIFGLERKVFARPTSCYKLFVGRCIDRDSFNSALAPTRYDPETLILIATPKSIIREWRLIIVGDQIVSGSQYACRGEKQLSEDCPVEVIDYANSILEKVPWRPDPAFMLDIAESEGKLWVMELNSFSCSWLYRCNFSKVVEATSSLAEKIWESEHKGYPKGF